MFCFVLLEHPQYKVVGLHLVVLFLADANSHSAIVFAASTRDGLNAIVSGTRAAYPCSYMAKVQIQLVVYDKGLGVIHLIKILRFLHGPAALIHKGRRFDDNYTCRADDAARLGAMHVFLEYPVIEFLFLYEMINYGKTDIVARTIVFLARVAETDNQYGRVESEGVKRRIRIENRFFYKKSHNLLLV